MMEETNQEVFALSGEEAFSLRNYHIENQTGSTRIKYIVCEPLEEAGFLNAFSTRVGGVSALSENSLNLTNFKGDTEANVAENRRRFLGAIGAEKMPLVTMRQTHSTERCFIESAAEAITSPPRGDALLTRLR